MENEVLTADPTAQLRFPFSCVCGSVAFPAGTAGRPVWRVYRSIVQTRRCAPHAPGSLSATQRGNEDSHRPASASLNLEKKKSPNKNQAQWGKEWCCLLGHKGYLILPNWELCPRAEPFLLRGMHHPHR